MGGDTMPFGTKPFGSSLKAGFLPILPMGGGGGSLANDSRAGSVGDRYPPGSHEHKNVSWAA
jgi:hypothetical protein